MAFYTLSGGPRGGETADFTVDVAGTTIDLPSERHGRVERYELRQNLSPDGEEIDGLFAIFVGTVKV